MGVVTILHLFHLGVSSANFYPDLCYLLNFSFQPAPERTDSPSLELDYIECDAYPASSTPAIPPTPLELSTLMETGVIRHVFAPTGPQSKPLWLDVNGRKGRRAVCVLYGDAMKYDVLDLDGAIEEEEGDQEDEEKSLEETGN